MHQVMRKFKDTKHDGRIYQVGDAYPAEGYKASKSRLEELATEKNKYGKVFIEAVKTDEQLAAEKAAAEKAAAEKEAADKAAAEKAAAEKGDQAAKE